MPNLSDLRKIMHLFLHERAPGTLQELKKGWGTLQKLKMGLDIGTLDGTYRPWDPPEIEEGPWSN